MKKKYKSLWIFLGLLIVAGITTYAGSIISSNNQQVVLCVTATQECKLFKSKEVHAQPGNPNPNCIIHPDLGNMCKPDYAIFQLKDVTSLARQKCVEKGHGTFSGWGTCTIGDTVYKFNPLGPGWKIVDKK